ncbi:hypothetical protein ABT063_35335 [Streptomyces sp. NPDC002838]|uniref:hypothetical protein n=1 Tax=Streptomyces sp. NPDC002838 TaxID=3154436 RepID=UPI00332C5774
MRPGLFGAVAVALRQHAAHGLEAVVHERMRPGVGLRPAWALWLGLAASVGALGRFAVQGFADEGRFPVLPALGLAAGLALVPLSGRRAGVRPPRRPEGPQHALEEAA